jgi:hypothetical protein
MKTRPQRSSDTAHNPEEVHMRSNKTRGPRPEGKDRRNVGVRRHRGVQHTEQRDVERSHEVMRVTSVAHRFLSPGVVVRAYFPFADGTDGKYRPAIVVGKQGQVVTLIALSTSQRAVDASDVSVLDLEEAGLHKATRARTARPECVDRAKVIQVLGRLSARDFTRILLVRSAA